MERRSRRPDAGVVMKRVLVFVLCLLTVLVAGVAARA